MKVSVSVLSSYDRLINAVKKVNNTSADFLHVDVMDGVFTDDVKFPLEVVKDLKVVSTKPLDVHLMVSDYETIKKYAKLAPAYLTFHVEILNDNSIINEIKALGIKVGLAINPETNVQKLFPYLDKIDLILFMSVEPGKGGQVFKEDVLDKVNIIKDMVGDKIIISIDGGVNDRSIRLCKHAGCNMVVSGSFVTNSDNYNERINMLR